MHNTRIYNIHLGRKTSIGANARFPVRLNAPGGAGRRPPLPKGLASIRTRRVAVAHVCPPKSKVYFGTPGPTNTQRWSGGGGGG